MPRSFIDNVKETKFDRGGVAGLKKYIDGTAPVDVASLYTPEEAKALEEANVPDRMKVKCSRHYYEIAKQSRPVLNLIKARPEETYDMSGEVDPSNQNKYSPIPGLLHKYELCLVFVSKTCSAHCRYCYRLDLFSGKTQKETAKIEDVKDYIIAHNKKVKENNCVDPETGKEIYTITEALLSGGDAMVLSNKKLAKIMSALAESGITKIRIGTKELAFFPQRFDSNFFEMLDMFHASYPHIRVCFITHFTHPDEFLQKDESGNWLKNGQYRIWRDEVAVPVKRLAKRHKYVYMANQTPIIADVNDDAFALHVLQKELFHHGIENHYFFQCREIEGHRAFARPVEESWKIVNQSMKGLSGIETHAKFAMSTEFGKIVVVGTTKPEHEGDSGNIIFKVLRSPGDASTRGGLVIAKRNPKALWVSGYADRVVYDETGVFDLINDPNREPNKEHNFF